MPSDRNKRRPGDRPDNRPDRRPSFGRQPRPTRDQDSQRPMYDEEHVQPVDFTPPRRPQEPPPPLPEGVPLVHLKSAGFGAFIYERMVDCVTGEPQDGDMVGVVDKWGRLFGWGFFNSRSQLALRMFSHGQAQPTDADISARVARAISLRRDMLKLDDSTNAYRLIHAEGDGLSGLIADRFGDYVVIELFSLAMYRRLAPVQDAMIDAGLSVNSFVVRADKIVCEQEGFHLGRDVDRKDRTVTITENGVKFAIRLGTGHKTGFFCDQRDNRLALTKFTPGKRVLDCCCYTGGFSCYSSKLGHAASVTAVDLDENALEVTKQNAKLNDANVDILHADAFDFLRQSQQQGKKWDVVILDPSKFVPKRTMMELGLRKYADLNRLAAGIVAPGGILLTCSCSGLVDVATFTSTVAKALRAGGRSAQILQTTGASADHPVMADTPESAYLKALWCRLD